MGISMMDFFVRETRAVVQGPIAIIRFGTCGGLARNSLPGRIVVASHGAALVTRNPDSFSDLYNDEHLKPTNMDFSVGYTLSKVFPL